MPALPNVPKVLRVRVLGVEGSDTSLGTHQTFQYSGTAPTVAQLTTLGGAIASAWNVDIAPLVTPDFQLNEILIQDLSSATSAVAAVATSHLGTRAGGNLPQNVAFSAQYQTTLRRRGGRWHGQWRMGSIADMATTQTWTGTFVTSALNGIQAFINAVDAAVWAGGGALSHVGVQYYGPPNRTVTSSSGRVRTVSSLLATPVVYPVVGYGAFPRLGSMRRRLNPSG